MTKKGLKVVHVSSEVEPFSKSGGLASVASALPKAQSILGHDVLVITPFYEKLINRKDFGLEEIGSDVLEISGKTYEVSYLKGYLNDKTPIFFISNSRFFGKRQNLYGAKKENTRFFFFDLAVLAFLRKINYQPDILHCHDWHTGLIPYFLKGRFKNENFWKNTATVFTIHNLAYQLGHDWWTITAKNKDNGRTILPAFSDSRRVETINFAKRAILSADTVNAVSETYREEIMTKDFGEELHRILKNREETVFGVVNGIDYEEYNPSTDPGLHNNFDAKNPEAKKANKTWLQKFLRFKVDNDTPLICMTSRIVEQKGFELVLEILPTILKADIQIAIMGDGQKSIVESLKKIKKQFPKKIAVIPFNVKYETSLYAGSDIFLLPSRFEPCGINQLIALRYGSIPVVHHIGGLADTIHNFNPEKKTGNGFTFKEYSPIALAMAIARILEVYKQKSIWNNLLVSVLQESHSWKIPAQKYVELYKSTIRRTRSKNKNL